MKDSILANVAPAVATFQTPSEKEERWQSSSPTFSSLTQVAYEALELLEGAEAEWNEVLHASKKRKTISYSTTQSISSFQLKLRASSIAIDTLTRELQVCKKPIPPEVVSRIAKEKTFIDQYVRTSENKLQKLGFNPKTGTPSSLSLDYLLYLLWNLFTVEEVDNSEEATEDFLAFLEDLVTAEDTSKPNKFTTLLRKHFTVKDNPGRGNCLLYSLVDELYPHASPAEKEEAQSRLRNQLVSKLKKNRHRLVPVFTDPRDGNETTISFNEYVRIVRNSGVELDNEALVVLARYVLKRPIYLIRKNGYHIENGKMVPKDNYRFGKEYEGQASPIYVFYQSHHYMHLKPRWRV